MSTAPILPAAALAAVMFAGGIVVTSAALDYSGEPPATTIAHGDGANVAPAPVPSPTPLRGGELVAAAATVAASHWERSTQIGKENLCSAFSENRNGMEASLLSPDGGVGSPDGPEQNEDGARTSEQRQFDVAALMGVLSHVCNN